MPIDFQRDTLIPLKLAVKFLPPSSRTGRQPHYSVAYRLASRGVLDAHGRRVYLEARKAGSCLCTTRAAIEAFLEATAAGGHTVDPEAKRQIDDLPSGQASRSPEDISRELDDMGL